MRKTNGNSMKRLTAKEEEVMGFFWEKGPLFVKQLLEFYPEPRPHFNTLSTIVRGLEEKGYLAHTAFGNTYQYRAAVSKFLLRGGLFAGKGRGDFDRGAERAYQASGGREIRLC